MLNAPGHADTSLGLKSRPLTSFVVTSRAECAALTKRLPEGAWARRAVPVRTVFWWAVPVARLPKPQARQDRPAPLQCRSAKSMYIPQSTGRMSCLPVRMWYPMWSPTDLSGGGMSGDPTPGRLNRS